MSVAFIGIGSNLNDPEKQLNQAIRALTQVVHVVRVSSFYLTKPQGFLAQDDFLNAVIQIETSLSPMALLECLLHIEARQGRIRSFANAPRCIDLDLLLFDDIVCHEEKPFSLILPHPRMMERGFVLVPLAEIAPDLLIHGYGAVSKYARCFSGENWLRLAQSIQ